MDRELAIDYTIDDPDSNTHFRKDKVTKVITHNYKKE